MICSGSLFDHTTIDLWLTLVLPKGCLTLFSRFFHCHSKTKRKLPKPSIYVIWHYLRSFWWRKNGSRPTCLNGVSKVSCQRWRIRGMLPPQKIRSCHFETNIDCKVLQFNVYIRNVVTFSCKPQNSVKFENFELYKQNVQNFRLKISGVARVSSARGKK